MGGGRALSSICTSLSRMDFVNALESDVSRTSSNVMEYRDIYARANEYLQNRRYDLALKSFEQLTFMRPDVTYFYASFVYLRSRVCDWSEYVNCILCVRPHPLTPTLAGTNQTYSDWKLYSRQI